MNSTIYRLQPVAGVNQHGGADQSGATAQVAADELLPGVDFRFGRLGEAVAGQIDQHQPATQIEHVDLLGPPRRPRDARQLIAPGQRVDQAGLADVGAARERDLGQARRRQLGELGDAGDEGALLGEQSPPRLEGCGVVEAVRVEDRRHRLRPGPPCAS